MSKYFDILAYLMGKAAGGGGGGGGGDVDVESKSISANGTYTAPAGKAYSPVSVNVPNSYAAGDEGKVVSNGALVAQGSDTVTQNGTVDTTLISSLAVNVSGGGGSSWTLVGSAEFEVNTSSTSQVTLDTINLAVDSLTGDEIIYVQVRDKAGKRNGYFYGHDAIFFGYKVKNNASGSTDIDGRITIIVKSDGKYDESPGQFGVYPASIAYREKTVSIVSRYSSSYSLTIDGTYKVDVYKLTPASDMVMFE